MTARAVSLRRSKILGVSLGLLLLICAPSVFSQEQGPATVDRDMYFQILDTLFTTDRYGKPEVLSAITVRFIPSFLPESQITLIRTRSKTIIVYLQTSQNIYGKLMERSRKNEAISAEAIRKAVKIETFVQDLAPDDGERWVSEFFLAMPETVREINRERIEEQKSGSVSVVLDGGFYQVSATHGMNRLTYCFYDENPHTAQVTGAYNLTRLSNRFRIDFLGRLPRR